tara:strand:+ start:4337 stop:7018 length:2682 start_codon:yes stop_codon:yes gene_type:complete
MHRLNQLCGLLLSTSLLISCGGGGGGAAESITQPSLPVPTPTVSLSTITQQAYEKSSQVAKFKLERSSSSAQLRVKYSIGGDSDITKSSASRDDYQLTYSDDKSAVGDSFEIEGNQTYRIIEVTPIDDDRHEVPETLVFTLTADSAYSIVSNQESLSLTISDADNSVANGKVFIGSFAAQGGANTIGSGQLSFILQGDNDNGLLSYSFSNLGSPQTDQHIHLSPSGNMIKDIESMGNLFNFDWDLAPGGIFRTEQEMLDTLFEGNFYVNIHSTNYPSGEISAPLSYQTSITPEEPTELSAEEVDQDIVRFLNQATFGTTPQQYQQLRGQINTAGDNRLEVYNDWIDQQIGKPQTSLLALSDATLKKFGAEDITVERDRGEPGENVRSDSFWPIALYGRDQLRQRMAFALSEILVVSDENSDVRKAYRGAANYWDMLARNAFGSYSQTLQDVTRHPIMGAYLSHLRNRKADPEAGYYPDENYAREVMQLFTFGLVQRRKNGSVILGENNLPIQTYDNAVIENLARVFTGLAFSHIANNNGNGEKLVNDLFSRGDFANANQYRWTEPMKFFPDYHDYGEKQLFSDNGNRLTITGGNASDPSSADSELSTVINSLVAHSSTAPNIALKLIQRFVTSNPSPEYIERVANAFGAEGDLNSTIKAILLDTEARNPTVASSLTFGKVKEPVLKLSALLRLLQAGSSIPLGSSSDNASNGLNYAQADRFDDGATLMRVGTPAIGQRPLAAPSVFNFFSPYFSPSGALSRNALVAPELQLTTESQLFDSFNGISGLLLNDQFYRRNAFVRFNIHFSLEQLKIRVDFIPLENLWDNTEGTEEAKATAVVDYLDFYLNAGQLAADADNVTRAAMISNVAEAIGEDRFNLAIYAAGNAPEFQLQK